jgi:RHS repeat-associated protein
MQIYDAYGIQRSPGVARTGYAGEVRDAATGDYVLGRRLYSPRLRRFLNPDAASPFGEGGFNRYAYCGCDPVNRIDPSGSAWWNWLTAGAASKATRVGTATADDGLPAAISTPTMGTATVSALIDVVAVSAGVRSKKAANLFGALTQDAASGSTGSALLRKDTTRSGRFLGDDLRSGQDRDAVRGPYNVTVFEADQRPPGKFRFSQRSGTLKIKTYWYKRTDPRDPNTSHWGADTAVTGPKMRDPLRKIGKMPIIDGYDNVYLYSGVHGHVRGKNWKNGVRRSAYAGFYAVDVHDKDRYSKLIPGRNLIVEDIGGISATDMIDRSSRPGVHLHGYCFGAVDNLLLDLVGADPVPVFRGT